MSSAERIFMRLAPAVPRALPSFALASCALASCALLGASFADGVLPTPPPEPPTAAGPKPLFEVLPFDGWRRLGGPARFELVEIGGAVEADGAATGPTLVGRGPIDRNGFLASPRVLGDFRLEVEVRLGSADDPRGAGMNSGIQIRSREVGGTVAGLQVEVDPTPRRWSGGVYDERGRGWLASLADNPKAQAAFRVGEWNRYEIECHGPRTRTSVNGVACAEWFDGGVSGLLAFQVHSGPACEVAFRAPRLVETGAHAWSPVEPTDAGPGSTARIELAEASVGVRFRLAGGATVRFVDRAGATIAEVPVRGDPPGSVRTEKEEAPRIEVLWVGGRGAALRAGSKVADVVLATAADALLVLPADESMPPTQIERLDPTASSRGG